MMKLSTILTFSLSILLTSCAYIPSSGPLVKDIEENQQHINIIQIDRQIANKLAQLETSVSFADLYPTTSAIYTGKTLEPGDIIEVRVWEAPPAVLFGSGMAGIATGNSSIGAVSFPAQMVTNNGTISIPFAGTLSVEGKSLRQVEQLITRRLNSKANNPQALASLVQGSTDKITVIGEVGQSIKVPVAFKKVTIIDALIAAGWVKHPVDQMSIQLNRSGKINSIALETIIKDPKQNIRLQESDTITALFQRLSFTILGANTKGAELKYEAKGITLAQALARSGGLDSNRADIKGIFIFRFEKSSDLARLQTDAVIDSADTTPVIYQLDFKNPASLFAAQIMPIKNKDFIYISEAPSVELKRFLDIVSKAIFSTVNVFNVIQ